MWNHAHGSRLNCFGCLLGVLGARFLRVVGVAPRRVESKANHQTFPFLAVPLNVVAMQVGRCQMGPLVPHGLLDEVLGVLVEQLPVQANMVFGGKRLARRCAPQIEA